MIVLDADVLLDVVLDREPHAESSSRLLDLMERRGRMGFVAWHTLANFYYLVRPARGRDRAREFLSGLSAFVRVVPTDTDELRFAAALPVPDLEDAMVIAAARASGALYIATRNLKDFKRSPVPARTPDQLLTQLA